MPRAGTHLVGAQRAKSKLKIERPEIGRILGNNRSLYRTGSIFPDVFYFNMPPYSRSRPDIGDEMHGVNGEPTNQYIIDMATHSRQEDDFAFLSGVLTHHALDQIMHPAIYFFTGNFFDTDDKCRADARLRHRRWETRIDHGLAKYKHLDMSRASRLEDVDALDAFESRFSVTRKQVVRATTTKFFLRSLSFMPWAYNAVNYLKEVKLLQDADVVGEESSAVFFDALKEERKLTKQDDWEYQNPVTGDHHVQSIGELLEAGVDRSVEMIGALYNFMQGGSEEQFREVVPGRSLESGLLGPEGAVSNMRYFSEKTKTMQRLLK